MGIFDEYLTKAKTMVRRKIIFNLVYDAIDEEFDADSTFEVVLVAADGTQAESFRPKVILLGISGAERTQLETFFKNKIDALLLETEYTIEP